MLSITTFHCLLWSGEWECWMEHLGGLGGGVLGKVLWRAELLFIMGGGGIWSLRGHLGGQMKRGEGNAGSQRLLARWNRVPCIVIPPHSPHNFSKLTKFMNEYIPHLLNVSLEWHCKGAITGSKSRISLQFLWHRLLNLSQSAVRIMLLLIKFCLFKMYIRLEYTNNDI